MASNVNHPAWKGKVDETFLKVITGVDSLAEIEDLQLCSLGLQNSHLESGVFNKLVSLEELNLSCNKLTKIPGDVVLKELKYLDISNNKVEDVEWLSKFSNLKDVDIYGNESVTIDDRYKIMFLLENLEKLDGKGVEEKEKIGNKFTLELLQRMENRWTRTFAQMLEKADTESKVNDVIKKFTTVSKETVRFGANSFKGFRLWRIETIAKQLVAFKITYPNCNYMKMLDGEITSSVSTSPTTLQKHKHVKGKEDQFKRKKLSVSGAETPLDYKPAIFLQCHSKEEGCDDFSTQVWCCAFEPDMNDPQKTTNRVATCGGDKVCVIDCNVGKVQSRFEQANEEFYTAAWTTISLGNHLSNILVAAGSLGFVHLIHVSQGINYGRIKAHSSPVQHVVFANTAPTHLLSADKKGFIYLIDIDIPTLPEYKFTIRKLMSFNGMDAIPLKLKTVKNYLLVGSETGFYFWKAQGLKSLHLSTDSKGKSILKNIPLSCEVTFPFVEEEDGMFDALEMITDEVVVTKCSLSGVIFLWHLSEVEDKLTSLRKSEKKVVEIQALAELKWASTKQCYMNISVCRKKCIIAAGDDMGHIWLYDVSTVINSNKTRADIPYVVIQPSNIVPYPVCTKPDGGMSTFLTVFYGKSVSVILKVVFAAENLF
ncbi:unnamed protein product [Clavelina lepadiformis]|uniref:Leucine-rich repeat and WD repeat-containing protein 1 n=1 Tax=Clavelina lepadiformis TaxID=159417 RepID=A0ABP0F8T0_CLALP